MTRTPILQGIFVWIHRSPMSDLAGGRCLENQCLLDQKLHEGRDLASCLPHSIVWRDRGHPPQSLSGSHHPLDTSPWGTATASCWPPCLLPATLLGCSLFKAPQLLLVSDRSSALGTGAALQAPRKLTLPLSPASTPHPLPSLVPPPCLCSHYPFCLGCLLQPFHVPSNPSVFFKG